MKKKERLTELEAAYNNYFASKEREERAKIIYKKLEKQCKLEGNNEISYIPIKGTERNN